MQLSPGLRTGLYMYTYIGESSKTLSCMNNTSHVLLQHEKARALINSSLLCRDLLPSCLDCTLGKNAQRLGRSPHSRFLSPCSRFLFLLIYRGLCGGESINSDFCLSPIFKKNHVDNEAKSSLPRGGGGEHVRHFDG